MYELPGSLRLTSTFPFVGRSAELETLRALMPMAEGEGRRVVLLSGEPGSGKSRLVREFAAEAAAAGALVLYGACDAVVRTPYGPFVEALEHARARRRPSRAARRAGHVGRRAHAAAPRPAGPRRRPAAHRSRPTRTPSATACTPPSPSCSWGSARRPVLLVLEDGHWADASTLLLLRHLARAAGNARVLAAGDLPRHRGRRPGDASRRRSPTCAAPTTSCGCASPASPTTTSASSCATPRRATPAPGRRSSPGDRRAHRGQRVPGLRAVARTGGDRHRRGGRRQRSAPTRPLAELGTPESVREVVSQRLSRLAPATTDLLELTATAGSEFGLDIVRAGRGPERARPPRCPRRGRPQRHDRGAALPPARLPVHARARAPRALRPALRGAARRDAPARGRGARALRGSLGPGPGGPRAPLRRRRALGRRAARHRVQRRAPPGQPPPRSRSTRRRCGCAPRWSSGSRSPARRAEVFLELGTASHRAGDALDALGAFEETAAIARELGDGELLARAAIGYEEACWRPGIANQGAVELLEEATTALGGDNPELRAGLLERACARTRLPGRARARRDRPHQRRGPRPPAARSGAARHGAGALVLVAGHELARRDPGDAHRGRGSQRGAGRHRDPRRGDGVACPHLRRAG